MINVFQTREAAKRFVEKSASLGRESKADFSLAIKQLADRKAVSTDGEFKEFKITTDDVLEVFNQIAR